MNSQTFLGFFPQFLGKSLIFSPLQGGLTNRNFKVQIDGECYVFRMSGVETEFLGIDRRLEAESSQDAARLGVGPEVCAALPDRGVMLRRFLEGCVLTPELIREAPRLARVTASLKRYHSQARRLGRFSPFQTIRSYCDLCRKRDLQLPDSLPEALHLLTTLEAKLQSDARSVACHNDLLPANFIDDGDTIRIIDWEYAGAGDPLFDLGNLAANGEFAPEDEHVLLKLYFGQVRNGELERLRMMRRISDLREAMWGFLQAATSSLESDYVQYGKRHLARFFSSTNGHS